ncbi:MAG: DegT/DnrJ/EryC1/StrS family aminotransferase [Clostridiales bacterium]|jgi:dTDP-4-amino-4,6-dideoxygalactose transaminase|nr:DegT/DnrJ/EryC1/StrS family aminotransferase [Clostridiales bacterium]
MEGIPITKPYFDGMEIDEIKKTLDSGWVAQGPKAALFEEMVSAHEGIAYGVSSTSCTTALQLAIRALGVGRGNDVILPSFTFIATANAVVCEGAVPVLVDICPESFTMSIEGLKEVISRYKKVRGSLINTISGNVLKLIIPVHLFGLCANMPEINRIAEENGLSVLEDSACALGSKIGGKHQGSFGNMSCLSFHPRKSITTGEGGMVLTDNLVLAEKLRSLRNHGAAVSGYERHGGADKGSLLPEYNEHGYNFRMTDIQAAMGIAQMNKLDYILSERKKKAAYYDRLLEPVKALKIPSAPDGYGHTYQSYVCLVNIGSVGSMEQAENLRDGAMRALAGQNISTRVGTHAVHNTGYYKKRFRFRRESFPVADMCERLSIALPLFVQMTNMEQELVASILSGFFNG